MTITIQENTEISLKDHPIQANIKAEEVKELFDEPTTRLMLLSESLCIFFGREKAQKIANICQFVEEDANKVRLAAASRNLSKNEKNNVREAIWSVYGHNVKILIQFLEPNGHNVNNYSNEVISLQDNSNFNWIKFKEIIKSKDDKLFNILDNKLLKVVDKPDRIIIKAVSFFIDRIVDPWSLEDLKKALVETNVILELYIKNSTPDNKNPIIFTPEKILEEQKIRKQKIADDFNNQELFRLIEKAAEGEVGDAFQKIK